MILRTYQDAGLTTMTSRRGRFAYADTVTGSGSYPQTVEEAIYIAFETNWLDGAIDSSQTIFTVDYPRFSSTAHPYIIIGSEVMLIEGAGTTAWTGGTTELHVARAQKGTVAAAHADGSTIYAWYQLLSGVLRAEDTTGGGKDAWVTYKPDGGAYASTQRLPAIAYNESKLYYRKVVIPSGTQAEWADDLCDRIANVTIDEAA